MKIEIADINSIKPYENNPRKLKDSAIEKVAMSLKEYGFRQPIVVDNNRNFNVGVVTATSLDVPPQPITSSSGCAAITKISLLFMNS